MSDTIQPSPQRARQGERITPASRQMVGDEGEIAAPHRVELVSIKRMLHKGKIDAAQYEAGRRFHLDFDEAGGSDVPALDLTKDRIDSGTHGMCLAVRFDSRTNLAHAYAALPKQAQRDVAFYLLGLGWKMSEVAFALETTRFKCENVSRETLTHLAEHYERIDRTVEGQLAKLA